MTYYIVHAETVEKLQKYVNYYVINGGQPIGSPFVFKDMILQAMLISDRNY